MSPLAVQAEGLTKHYRIPSPGAPSIRDYLRRPFWSARQPSRVLVEALRDVSFSVEEGEVFGIIGRNGAGKSTLLKILSRITAPTAGRAVMRGRLASLLEVGTGFHPELTGRENIYLNGMLLGMREAEVDRVLEEICEFAGVGRYLNVPIKRYSSGMQLRLAFAVAAHLAADTMIIDEVLAVGDAEFQAKCAAAMSSASGRGRTTLFVSHNMAAVEHLCSRVLWLEHGRVRAIGPAREIVREYLLGVGHAAGEQREYRAAPGARRRGPVHVERAAVTSLEHGRSGAGDELALELELDVREPCRGLQLGLALGTLDGIQVGWVSNADYRQDWDLEPGTYRIAVRFPDLRLLPRRYLVSLQTFRNWGAEPFEQIENALSFTVPERDILGHGVVLGSDRGMTWLPAEFRVEATVDEPELQGISTGGRER